MNENESEWELEPSNAHPRAAEILTDEFFWNCVDDNSPFGNDNGADILEFYREWREDNKPSDALSFFNDILDNWDVNSSAFEGITDPNELENVYDDFNVHSYDDCIIALAFGQLLFDGEVNDEIRKLTLEAIDRQMAPVCLNYYGEEIHDERKIRLNRMKEIILSL